MQIRIFVEQKPVATSTPTVATLRELRETVDAEDAPAAVRQLIAANRFPGAVYFIASDVPDEVNVVTEGLVR